jgi:hypothetical protein
MIIGLIAAAQGSQACDKREKSERFCRLRKFLETFKHWHGGGHDLKARCYQIDKLSIQYYLIILACVSCVGAG